MTSILYELKNFVVSPWNAPLQRNPSNQKISLNFNNIKNIIQRITRLPIVLGLILFPVSLIGTGIAGIGALAGAVTALKASELGLLLAVELVCCLCNMQVFNIKIKLFREAIKRGELF